MIIPDETLEAMARAHDEAESAQKGEPSPWRADLMAAYAFESGDGPLEDWRAERIAAMRAGVEALLSSEWWLLNGPGAGRPTGLLEEAGAPCKTCGSPATHVATATPELPWPVCAAHLPHAMVAGWFPIRELGKP